MTNRIILIILSLLLTISTNGQDIGPMELAQKIFSKTPFTDIQRFSTGEYTGRPNGQDLGKDSTTTFALLAQDDMKAVVAMTILDSSGKGVDTYLHFENTDGWKMSAFRSLATTGIIEKIKNGLELMTPEQVDQEIKRAKSDPNALFKSREEYLYELGNARLTLALDEDIKKHFLANQGEFERLKNLAVKNLDGKGIPKGRSIALIESHKSDYQKLFISSVSTGGYELGNCIGFLIGGMIDNSVGYFYARTKKDVPEMNPDRIIMIREIGNGWYIYKTT